MDKYIINIFTVVSVLIIGIMGFLLITERQKYDKLVIDTEISNTKLELDSITVLNKELGEKNVIIENQVVELCELKDSLSTRIEEKEVKVNKTKEKRDEKIEQIVYGSDSTILSILSNHEYESKLKASKGK